MEHLLTCTCGRLIRVTRSQAGQELTCECGQKLQVPTLRGLGQLPVADTTDVSGASTERKAWGGWRGTMFAAACAVFVLSVLPCAYFLYIRSQIDTSYTVTDEIAAGDANYDAMGLEMLVAEWTSFERGGLGPKNKPPFYWMKIVARENEILAMVTGSIAGVSALIAAAIWMSTPKIAK